MPVVAALALAYLLVPVVVVVVFSFNQPSGRYNVTWERFSTAAWRDVCGVPGLCDSVLRSVRIAALATVAATLLGTLMAFPLARYRFTGRRWVTLLVYLPVATPEVVLGASLLALFVQAGVAQGTGTILAAHVPFCLSVVVVTVKARLAGTDPLLEHAAADLYATGWQVFRWVTLPLLVPGIVAAALLSFSLSFDDFVVTNFTSGSVVTFPMFVYGASQRGVPPEVNVVGSVLFLLALLATAVAAAGTGRVRGWPGRRSG